jgi:AcrR family transcriptional regulator
MGKPTLRDRKRKQVRFDLLRAAVELFHTLGYQNTSVDQIVEAANCSRSTFFRYFGSKEDVIFGDLVDRFAKFDKALSEGVPRADSWTTAREILTWTVFDVLGEAPDLGRARLRLWYTVPALHARLGGLLIQFEDRLFQFFEESGLEGKSRLERRIIAALMFGVFRASLHEHVVNDVPITIGLERGLDFVEAGLKESRASD